MEPQEKTLRMLDFEAMTQGELSDYVSTASHESILALLTLIREQRAVSWDDRMLLQMVEKSPFSFWASDRTYKVRLWKGKSAEIYKRNMVDKEFHEFISRLERRQAMIDSIRIINASSEELPQLLEEFRNYYTRDIVGTTVEVGLITNSIQLFDPETGETLYSEIGLPIDWIEAQNAYEERKKEFEEEINEFRKQCSELKKKYNKEKERLLENISGDSSLSSGQKTELRKKCRTIFDRMISDLERARKELAIDLDKYLADTEEALQADTELIEDEIRNQSPAIQRAETREELTKIKKELMERIKEFRTRLQSRFGDLITDLKGLVVSDGFKEDKARRIKEVEEKRDNYLRALSEFQQSIDESHMPRTLRLIEKAVSELESDVTSYIAEERSKS